MKLSVIIVNYNVKHYLAQCLDSVQRALQGIDSEVIVVDNHSRDGSVEWLRPRFPHVSFIESNHNLGFARANNLAIRRSRGEYVLLLNPDTIVGEQVLADVLRFMDAHPQAGAAGVQMLKTDGQRAMESRRGRPTPMVAFYKMTGLCARFPRSRRFGRYYMGYLPWDAPARIDVVSGAFFMARRRVLDEVGLLDEDFFMYGEDIDLSCRILNAGYENWYVPVRILHYKGESTEKSSFRYVHVFYEAMLIFFRKHYGHLGFWLSIPIKAAVYAKALTALLSLQLQRVHRMMGFAPRKDRQTAVYAFVGSDAMQQECRELARRKGLECAGADEESSRHNGIYYKVYDTDHYGYARMLDELAGNQNGNLRLGTYSMQTRTLITAEETYT